MKNFTSNTLGPGFLIVFSLPFLLAGLAVLGLGVWPLLRSFDAQSWIQVPAKIESASVKISSGGKRSSSYQLIGTYTYEVEGQRYTSENISFYFGADNISSYHHDRFRELEPYIGTGRIFRAYVNPADHSDAVLFREARADSSIFMIVFGLVFATSGLAILLAGLFSNRALKARKLGEANHPTEPWLHRSDWVKREVKCSSHWAVLGLLFASISVNGIAAIITIMVIEKLSSSSPNYFAIVALIFNIIGLALIWATVHAFLHWRRFGRSTLRLSEIPFRIGNELKANLELSNEVIKGAKELSVHLVCRKSLTTGSGKSRSIQVTTLAEEKATVNLSTGISSGEKAVIPVRIRIPESGQPTQETENPSISWNLSFKAELKGVDYSANFAVPVF